MNEPRRVVVYTDGGSEPNPGIGGWGAVVIGPAAAERRELSGGEETTTNNRMELTAALRALEALAPGHEVDLHTDSSYLRLGITQWLPRWKRSGWRVRGGDPVKNDDLWRELEAAAGRHRVRWHWVKGHSGQEHNERAHTLAAAEIARRRRGGARIALPGVAGGVSAARDGVGAADDATTSQSDPAPDVEILLKLSCAGGRGAWAARLRRGEQETVLGGAVSGVTANRLELLAAADVLAVLRDRERVDWRGGSDYLREGAAKWLQGWRRRGYRTSSGDPVKNADVWRVLEQALARHTIRFRPAGEDDGPELAALEREAKSRLGRLR